MQRKNSKQYVTRLNKTLIERDIDIENITNQRVKIHNRKLYFYGTKPIGFAVANSVEVQLAEESREIGFFSNRSVIDAFHLKNKDSEKKEEKPYKRDVSHRDTDLKLREKINTHHYPDKAQPKQQSYTNNTNMTKDPREGLLRPKIRDLSSENRPPPSRTNQPLNNISTRQYQPRRAIYDNLEYEPTRRYLENPAQIDNEISPQVYKEANDPTYDNKYDYTNNNTMQPIIPEESWYDKPLYDKQPPDSQPGSTNNFNYIKQNTAVDVKPEIEKKHENDKHHSIESDSSYDGDDLYGITKLDVFVEELKNEYFKLNNGKNCITYFEGKFIFGICIKNDENQEFKLVNVDALLYKLKEEQEKMPKTETTATHTVTKPSDVTITVTASPNTVTKTETNYTSVLSEPIFYPPQTKEQTLRYSPKDKLDKAIYSKNVPEREIEDEKGDDFFDKNSGDLLEALQKNFSFKDMPF